MTSAVHGNPSLYSIKQGGSNDVIEQMCHFERVDRYFVDHRSNETASAKYPASIDGSRRARGSGQLSMKPCNSAGCAVDDRHQSQVRHGLHRHRTELFQHGSDKHLGLVGVGVLKRHEEGLLGVRHESNASICLAAEREPFLLGCDSCCGVDGESGKERLRPRSPDLGLKAWDAQNPRAIQRVGHLELRSIVEGKS